MFFISSTRLGLPRNVTAPLFLASSGGGAAAAGAASGGGGGGGARPSGTCQSKG